MSADNENLLRAYRMVFGSPEGRIVMNDLMKFCNFRTGVDTPVDEGKRRVFLRIVQFVELTDEQIYAAFAGRPINQPDGASND